MSYQRRRCSVGSRQIQVTLHLRAETPGAGTSLPKHLYLWRYTMHMQQTAVKLGMVVSVTMHGLHCRGIVVGNGELAGAWVLTIQSEDGFMVTVDWAKSPEVSLVAESSDDLHHLEPA